MFGSIGGAEFFLILVLALLLFGPRKLPQIGRTIGKALAEFRGAAHEFKSSLEREVAVDDLKEAKTELTDARREVDQAVRDASRPPIDRGSIARPAEPTTDAGGDPSPPAPSDAPPTDKS